MVSEHLIYHLEISELSNVEKEVISAILGSYEVDAIEEFVSGLSVYHQDKVILDSYKSRLMEALDWLKEDHITISSLKNKNWNKLWESSFEPIVIEGFCTVKATFHSEPIETPYVITINPELAFGTGHHETTFQMMDALRDISLKKKNILDYGCGTGILAIIARLLGAGAIDAIDYDAQAIDCAEECLNLNKVEDIALYTGELEMLSEKKYDIILANINRNVLLKNGSLLGKMQDVGGVLLLSGILLRDEAIILEAYSNAGYTLVEKRQKGNWLCLKMTRE